MREYIYMRVFKDGFLRVVWQKHAIEMEFFRSFWSVYDERVGIDDISHRVLNSLLHRG